MEFKKTTIDEALSHPVGEQTEADPEETPKEKAPRVWAGKRLVALIASVAVIALLAGVVIMQFIVSPAQLAARTAPPEAGPVTAAVEERVIENTITTRGEVTYADSVDVTIDTSTSEGRAIVTGQVPQVGTVLEAGNVALEVAGRPVIVLPGDLPSYRSLSIGMRGPDVLQLKKALDSLGIWAGDVESDVYEWDTATGVGDLYQWVGYEAPTGGEAAQEALRNAQSAVRNAEIGVTRAEATWNQAAQQSDDVDLSVENAQIEEAKAARTDAYNALESAQEAVLPTLPSGEVLFLGSLPRRVDEVFVKRGDALSGKAMTVSGATLTIVGTLSKQDADLLQEGMKASYATPGGTDLEATVAKIEAPGSSGSSDGSNSQDGAGNGAGKPASSSDRYTVRLDPGQLTEEQISELRGSNVRVKIPVASTDGKVLAVPLAALSAGADGGNRVELLVPDANDPYKTEVVEVTAGLAADGYVQITSSDSRIKAGAKVVVGK